MEDDLHALKAHVYGIAGQHPDEAKSIIQPAGMFQQLKARLKPSSKEIFDVRLQSRIRPDAVGDAVRG